MIAQQLLDSGLLELGLFVEQGRRIPYRLHLEMLPAYPKLFQTMTQAVIDKLPAKPFDRLVTSADCAVLGGAIVQKTGIPLVYSRGRGETPVFDLVGAYDVGHPACLIVNSADDSLATFVAQCRHVGLYIHTVITLVGDNYPIDDIAILSVFTLEQLITELYSTGHIPQPQLEAVLRQLAAT
jgi:hypothetical protein